VIGFFVSSCVEYIALARKLERITSALTLSQTHTQAGEVMVLGARRHTVVADIYMNARNQSADDNSLRLRSCTVDIPTASPSYLMFIERNVGSNEAFQPSDILGLNPSQTYLKFASTGRPSDDLVVMTRPEEDDRWRRSPSCLAACFFLYTTVLTVW
jgi:hypothetical protein